jgi:hypothetical protein
VELRNVGELYRPVVGKGIRTASGPFNNPFGGTALFTSGVSSSFNSYQPQKTVPFTAIGTRRRPPLLPFCFLVPDRITVPQRVQFGTVEVYHALSFTLGAGKRKC